MSRRTLQHKTLDGLTFPVSEVTIAANFDDMLKRIDAVADDLQLRNSTAAPTFRVSHMTIAGTSR